MPLAVYLLALAVFAQGTSEFMLAGLVPDIAADLGVSIPAAGSLTSGFALGMIVGAPLMAVLSLRWSRRAALLAFLVTFLLAHVVGALTTSYPVLLGTRAVAALANAGFLAVALATATALVAPGATGRATSVLLGGVTAACVAGVPGGALLGQAWGWRSAFWAVAIACLPAVVAVLRSVPQLRPSPARIGVGGELGALRERRLLLALVLGALVNGATFCSFTYLAPLVTEVSGISEGLVPAVLALFGAGSFAGVTLGGRAADSGRARPLLAGGGGALLVGWVVLAAVATVPAAVLVLVVVQGMLSFAVGSSLIARALYAATRAPNLGGAFATAAFNVGAATGPWLGGFAIEAGLGYRSPVWVSALLVLAAAAVGVATTAFSRPRRSAARS
ncbi:Cmx/CmrA family chloramphenicol efflux MFS transporter [Jiangella asiatica]|uniref:MFS transporter n=1 Tax=Jiangella asiatica TaxID=2530372 RepID=A0A4R5CM49_9ACTN|nr:Cmx/CmrA family chloramphenicol efflux MFS transporter [Jiangella asiatica]TDE01056.1 MFS transporter [Jiangella asiatica]